MRLEYRCNIACSILLRIYRSAFDNRSTGCPSGSSCTIFSDNDIGLLFRMDLAHEGLIQAAEI